MIIPDYATYREQLKSLNPNMKEKDIYQWYRGVVSRGWSVQTEPARGHDGKFHFLYLSVSEDINKDTGLHDIYSGVHNPDNLDDDYQGSGYDIKALKDLGKKFKTYPLEFFKTEDDAYFAEKEIVNEAFIRSPMVLNRVLGGKNPDDDVKKNLGKTIQETVTTTPKADVSPYKNTSVTKKKQNGDPFSALDVKVGGVLTYVKDKTKTFKVANEWEVWYNGKSVKLSTVLSTIMGTQFKGNPLHYFEYNGKNLGEKQREIRRKRV